MSQTLKALAGIALAVSVAAPMAYARDIEVEESDRARTETHIDVRVGGTRVDGDAVVGEDETVEAEADRATTTRGENVHALERDTDESEETRTSVRTEMTDSTKEARNIIANVVRYVLGLVNRADEVGTEVREAARVETEVGTTTPANATVSVFINWFINLFSK
jgi:hypothetical protein